MKTTKKNLSRERRWWDMQDKVHGTDIPSTENTGKKLIYPVERCKKSFRQARQAHERLPPDEHKEREGKEQEDEEGIRRRNQESRKEKMGEDTFTSPCKKKIPTWKGIINPFRKTPLVNYSPSIFRGCRKINKWKRKEKEIEAGEEATIDKEGQEWRPQEKQN